MQTNSLLSTFGTQIYIFFFPEKSVLRCSGEADILMTSEFKVVCLFEESYGERNVFQSCLHIVMGLYSVHTYWRAISECICEHFFQLVTRTHTCDTLLMVCSVSKFVPLLQNVAIKSKTCAAQSFLWKIFMVEVCVLWSCVTSTN